MLPHVIPGSYFYLFYTLLVSHSNYEIRFRKLALTNGGGGLYLGQNLSYTFCGPF